MKCEKHNAEMKWVGTLSSGGMVCMLCKYEQSMPSRYQDSRSANNYMHWWGDSRSPSPFFEPEGKKGMEEYFLPHPRQSGRTTRALQALLKWCEENGKDARYVVMNPCMARHCAGVLQEHGCRRVSHTQVLTPGGHVIRMVKGGDFFHLRPDLKQYAFFIDHASGLPKGTGALAYSGGDLVALVV